MSAEKGDYDKLQNVLYDLFIIPLHELAKLKAIKDSHTYDA